MRGGHIPLRMCIACRQMREKSSLLRVVRDTSGNISIDNSLKAEGRGAYICKDSACIEKCIKRKLLNKTFSAGVENAIYDKLKQQGE